MPDFLHGVETVESTKGPRPITVVRSAVIAVVGVAPLGTANTPIMVTKESDFSQFGSPIPGFTIPQALSAIADKGAGVVIVVNTFNAATNTKTVAATNLPAIASRKTKTAEAPLSNLVVTNSDASTTYVNGTDYIVDDYGNITILSNTIADGAVLKAAYKALDTATVTSTQIIGTIDGTTAARTGFKCLDLVYSMFGFKPKILIAPGFSQLAAVTTEMIAQANKLKAYALIDAPTATTIAAAITGRGPAGSINFNTSSDRADLCFPMLKISDPNPGNAIIDPVNGSSRQPDILSWHSAHKAGLIAAVDNNEGYWVSPSNHEIFGITGVERVITASLTDKTADCQVLNSVGINTVFMGFGTGIRHFGNSNASFPSNTFPTRFTSVRRTADVIEESIELAQIAFLDGPINLATIDNVRETVNKFLRTLKQRGAIIDGECLFDPADNPDTELALGHVTYTYTFMPPTPMERITFKAVLDISILSQLTVTSNA